MPVQPTDLILVWHVSDCFLAPMSHFFSPLLICRLFSFDCENVLFSLSYHLHLPPIFLSLKISHFRWYPNTFFVDSDYRFGWGIKWPILLLHGQFFPSELMWCLYILIEYGMRCRWRKVGRTHTEPLSCLKLQMSGLKAEAKKIISVWSRLISTSCQVYKYSLL